MAQALVLALVGILAAVLNRLSGGALHTWIPWFTQQLLDLAIKRLPEDQGERFRGSGRVTSTKFQETSARLRLPGAASQPLTKWLHY
jgi:hypothetical protein